MPIEFHRNIALYRYWSLKSPERTEAIVEKWIKEHPVQTNAMKFKEVFGISLGEATERDLNIFVWGLRPYEAPKEE